ncbi:hypothetical protein POW97_21005, partial [Hafnia alvei]|uniref:hypothetical protein n=1 Tax=Hafnia alvei TaxID=569 RepID=UPI002FFA3176
PPVQGCTGGVWGALDGRYQTGAEMASRIKARELRAPAQRGSHRTPTPLVSWEYICSQADETFH